MPLVELKLTYFPPPSVCRGAVQEWPPLRAHQLTAWPERTLRWVRASADDYTCVADSGSRYILEGRELEFYVKKMQKKKGKQ
jgi:hypothetical protein